MPFQIVRNDIITMRVDVVVNTANPRPVIGSGVDAGIHRAAGEKLLEAREKIGRIGVGEAAITPGFDKETDVIHDRISLDRVPALTEKEYYVRGCTALLDAVGGAIHHIGNVHKYAREEDRPEKTLFVITTDGMENASRR